VALYEVAAYAASKAAVASLTKSLAVEWSKRGVLVNAIAPGVFRTALNSQLLDSTPRGQEFLTRTPMGRFGKTEELVGRRFIWLPTRLRLLRARLLPWMADFWPAA
jgi:NAD(P)-dependent dehydrogenase (short-subunit alcohol dehydrogenase family)